MRVLSGAIFVLLALILAGPAAAPVPARSGGLLVPLPSKPAAAKQKKVRHPSPVGVRMAAGYSGQFRPSAWLPVRVTLHNRTAGTFSGSVELPVSGNTNIGPPLDGHALYQQSVVLPAGSTKEITMYLPGDNNPGEVDAVFRSGGHVLGRAQAYISNFNDGDFLVATLSGDPQAVHWVRQMSLATFSEVPVTLTTGTFDSISQALATFDSIILSNEDTGSLDLAQRTALAQWVQNGGCLVLVGGPTGAETMRGLPAPLLPGRLGGSTTLPNLSGLRQQSSVPPPRSTTVSVVTHPRGAVLASERGVPLVIRHGLGKGNVLYLAFDPALDPITHWRGALTYLNSLIRGAAPVAMMRLSLPTGYSPPPFWAAGPFGPGSISTELANVPAAALPSLILFILLTVGYILLLGPVNFLVLRRFRRREFAWVTIPLLSLLCVGSTFGVAIHLKGNTVLVNSIGVVELDGHDDPAPASFYSGLFAPVRGDYHLTYNAPALPQIVPQYAYFGGPGPVANPLTMRLEEGSQTSITLLSMNMWSMRDIALHTSVHVPGTIESDLHPDAHGYLIGTVHNGTNLNLIRPVILAGRTVTHLPDLPAGASRQIRARAGIDPHDHSQIAASLFGQPSWGGTRYFVKSGLLGGLTFSSPIGIGGICCPGPPQAEENSLNDRIRNAGLFLPETQNITSLGEVVLVGWTQQSLGSMTVDGATPHRRDLTMVASPVSIRFVPGRFRLRRGMLGAHLVDLLPGVTTTGCCPGGPWVKPMDIGSQGHAIFAFDVPDAAHVHFSRLTLSVDAGGPAGTGIGSVYDWPRHHWVPVDLSSGDVSLSHPERFLSPQGRVLIRLRPTGDTGDVLIADPHQNLQISGSGWVS
jgi:hypothetical protein